MAGRFFCMPHSLATWGGGGEKMAGKEMAVVTLLAQLWFGSFIKGDFHAIEAPKKKLKWHISIFPPCGSHFLNHNLWKSTSVWPLGVLGGESKSPQLFNSTVSTCQDQGESPHVDSLPFYVTHYHLNATRGLQCLQWNRSRGWLSEAGHETHSQPLKFNPQLTKDHRLR